MDYKIVFSDIDGTVLTSEHTVLPSTIKAVKSLQEQSIPFVLVSARMPEAICTVTKVMQVNNPMISYGGALILDAQGNILYDKKIALAEANDIIMQIKTTWHDAVTINYYSDNAWYVEDLANKDVVREEAITQVKAQRADFADLLHRKILPNKILCIAQRKICDDLEKTLVKQYPELKIVRSSDILLEIMDKSVAKSTGIEILLQHFNLTANQAIAFGDNYNDVDMLKLVGCGIAMQNAPDDVKAIANDITDSNNDDGIYNYLQKLK